MGFHASTQLLLPSALRPVVVVPDAFITRNCLSAYEVN